jgi:alpha-amylase
MTKYSNALLLLTLTILVGCTTTQSVSENQAPFIWEAASVYFLMTDRFYNGDKSNDTNFNRTKTTGKLRGFEGGDKGITKKLTKAISTN